MKLIDQLVDNSIIAFSLPGDGFRYVLELRLKNAGW